MKIETIFGGIAVLALLALVAFALTTGDRGVRAAVPAAGITLSAAPAALDACGCYDAAYEAARANPDYTRPAYEGGYSVCREASGRSGGDAWTQGWEAGLTGRSARKSCRAF